MSATTNISGLVDKTAANVPSWSFDTNLGQYRAANGKLLSNSELRDGIKGVIDGAKQEAAALTKDMQGGKINLEDWKAGMLILIASLHAVASAAATAGVPGVVSLGEEDLRQALAKEGVFISRFARQIERFLLFGGLVAVATMTPPPVQRAQSYMDAALMTFERQRYMLHLFLGYTEGRRVLTAKESCPGCTELADLGWVPIEEFVPLGHEECGQWCECEAEYARVEG